MVKLHLELEGDVGEVVRVLRRIGGGDNAGGEVRDGPRPALAEERTSGQTGDVQLWAGDNGSFCSGLVPGRWTGGAISSTAADFTAGLDVVARRVMFQV